MFEWPFYTGFTVCILRADKMAIWFRASLLVSLRFINYNFGFWSWFSLFGSFLECSILLLRLGMGCRNGLRQSVSPSINLLSSPYLLKPLKDVHVPLSETVNRTHDSATQTMCAQGHTSRSWDVPFNFVPSNILLGKTICRTLGQGHGHTSRSLDFPFKFVPLHIFWIIRKIFI